MKIAVGTIVQFKEDADLLGALVDNYLAAVDEGQMLVVNDDHRAAFRATYVSAAGRIKLLADMLMRVEATVTAK